MELIKPQKLQAGDKVAAISLSWGGPATVPHRYAAGKRQLQDEFGVTVVETRHALRDAAWLSANPQARAADLMEAFADPSIKAIISTIGGDDSIRILPYIDLDVIRANPKIFLGYSDSTITHLACFKAGLVSFYGPAIMAGFAENGGMHDYLIQSVRQMLFSADLQHSDQPQSPTPILPNQQGWTVEHLAWKEPRNQARPRTLTPATGWNWLQGKGVWRGRLVGGCFEVFDFLRGTQFWPSAAQWQDAILFLETSEDMPSPTDLKYALRSYAAMGILKKLSGILFGRPGGQLAPERFAEYDAVLKQVVTDEEGLADLPIVTQMDFGHTDPMCVLPYGISAEINFEMQQLTLLENALITA